MTERPPIETFAPALPAAVREPTMRGYLAGRGFMLWRESPRIGGLALWGAQGEEQARAIIDLCSDGLGAAGAIDPGVPFTALLDLRRAGKIDLSAFSVFHAWLREVNERHADLAVVMVCEPSPDSATILGLVQMSAPHIVQAVADELDPILERAGAPRGLMRRVEATLDALIAPSTSDALRGLLRREQAQISVERAARALGMSARALQRALEREGTTFEQERGAVRKAIYEALVGDASVKIDAVAATLGFGSVRAFSTAFRRAVGVSPRAYRQGRARSGDGPPSAGW